MITNYLEQYEYNGNNGLAPKPDLNYIQLDCCFTHCKCRYMLRCNHLEDIFRLKT